MPLTTSTGEYLSYYMTYLLATGVIEGTVGERFEAGRIGIYTIEKDPPATRACAP
jgi:hypothetical protein